MGRAGNYLNATGRTTRYLNVDRAEDIGRHIAVQDIPIVITRTTAGGTPTQLAAQNVRIEVLGGSSFTNERRGDVAERGKIQVGVFGYLNHPTETDTDIKRGDTFPYGDQVFEVIAVYPVQQHRLLAVANAEA